MNYIKWGYGRKVWPNVLLFWGFVLALSACGGPAAETENKKREFSLPVQIGKVVYMDVIDQVRTVGNLQAEQRVMITTEVAGQITKISVDEGQKVKRGALLAQVDPREYRLEKERLQTELAAAEKEYQKALQGLRPEDKEKLEAQVSADASALDLANKEKVRVEKLIAQGFISQSELDQAIDKVRRAADALRASKAALAAGMKSRDEDIDLKKAEVEGIKKKIAVARLDLNKGSIRAPFSGVIIAKKIERGAYAPAGTPIVEMIGSSRLKVVLEMPQSYRGKLENLQGADFLVRDLGLRFQHGSELARQVRVIPDANIYSGNIKVQVDLPDPDPSLFPGLNLEALLRFGTRKNVLHVPSVSLVITEQGTVVYIVKDQRAHLVPVKAFKERNEYVEIEDFTHQLGPDVDLVLRGSGAVFPGAKVFATNPEPETQTPFNAASKEPDTGKEQVKSPET